MLAPVHFCVAIDIWWQSPKSIWARSLRWPGVHWGQCLFL